VRLGDRRVSPDTGALLADEQRHGLEPGALPHGHLPTLDRGLDLSYRFREDRDQPGVILTPAWATPGTPAHSGPVVTFRGQPITLFLVLLLRRWRTELASAPRPSVGSPDMAATSLMGAVVPLDLIGTGCVGTHHWHGDLVSSVAWRQP
jgi:hypothetical protein